LGCRNIFKAICAKWIWLQTFLKVLNALRIWPSIINIWNNFDYNNAIFLLKSFLFYKTVSWFSGESRIPSLSPFVHYEQYDSIESLSKVLMAQNRKFNASLQHFIKIEFIIGRTELLVLDKFSLPHCGDYADGIDTMEFLIKSVVINFTF